MNIQLDDGFMFGLGAFETICVKEGMPLFLDWHLERLGRALDFLGIRQSVNCKEVTEFLQEHRDSIPDWHALKIMISGQNKVFVLRENPYTQERLNKGFVLDYSKILRNETSPFVFHKTMNYGDNILEKRKTHDMDIDEVLFLNSRGEICEGSTTNVFFVKGNEIITPSVESGLLPGIVRRFVTERFAVVEKVIHKEDVDDMDECFVTNSLMGIMPVTAIGHKEFPVGSKTRECMTEYLKAIHKYSGCCFQFI